VLLKCGMTWKEFSDLSKSIFVAVAADEFGIRGRPANTSKISILTGISRKEVKRQRDLLVAEAPQASSKTTDATRLLSAWFQSEDYLDGDGKPLPLPESGSAPSFASLFATYGGDTPAQTLLKELIAAGSIAKDEQDRYVAVRRYHMPVEMDPGVLRFFGTNLHDHANTLGNNLTGDAKQRRLEGFAVDDRIHPDALPEFRQFLDQRGQQFLEEVDDWLQKNRVSAGDQTAQPVRAGLGLYAIEGPLPKGTLS